MAARHPSMVIHRSPSLETVSTDSAPSTPVKPQFINPFTAQFIKRSSECWSEVPPIPFADCRPNASLTPFSSYPYHHAASTHLPFLGTILKWLNKRKRQILTLVAALCFVSLCTIATDCIHNSSYRRRGIFSNVQDVLGASGSSDLRHPGDTRPHSHMALDGTRFHRGEELVLSQQEELGALISFMAANTVNALPNTVDPSQSLDPQLFLDFDTRSLGAREELNTVRGTKL